MKNAEIIAAIRSKFQFNDITDLEQFNDPKLWKNFTEEDRDSLAFLFTLKGEELLKEKGNAYKEWFDAANAVCPDSPRVLRRQGSSLSKDPYNVPRLRRACVLFEKAAALGMNIFHLWLHWGIAEQMVGQADQDLERMEHSIETLSKAESLFSEAQQPELAQLYYSKGGGLAILGHLQQDVKKGIAAIEYFRKAAKFGIQDFKFWFDYGFTCLQYGKMLEKMEWISEAIDAFQKSVELNPEDFNAYLQLSIALATLYNRDPAEPVYDLAEGYLKKMVQLFSETPEILMLWAQIEVSRGKLCFDPKKLQSACKKLEKIERAEPNNALATSYHCDTLLLLAKWEDNVNTLKKVQRKVDELLKTHPKLPQAYLLQGSCLEQLGEYFDNVDYYTQAIEVLEKGTRLDPSLFYIWERLMVTHYQRGLLNDEMSDLEKALSYCDNVVKYGGGEYIPFLADWGDLLLEVGERKGDDALLQMGLSKHEKAYQLLETLVVGVFELMDVSHRYACALETLGDLKRNSAYLNKGIEVLEMLVQEFSFNPDLYLTLGTLYKRLGELLYFKEDCFVHAIENFERYLKDEPEDDFAWLELGVTLMHLARRREEAPAIYKQAEEKLLISMQQGNEEAIYALAAVNALQNNLPEALMYLKKARECEMLPTPEDLLIDPWMGNLQEMPEFKQFLKVLKDEVGC